MRVSTPLDVQDEEADSEKRRTSRPWGAKRQIGRPLRSHSEASGELCSGISEPARCSRSHRDISSEEGAEFAAKVDVPRREGESVLLGAQHIVS